MLIGTKILGACMEYVGRTNYRCDMRRNKAIAIVSAAASLTFMLGACGSSSTSSVSSDTAAASSSDAPASTVSPPVEADKGADGTYAISVTVGMDDFTALAGSGGVYSVPQGAKVTITLTDNGSDEEYHLHGYDLLAKATAGNPGVITFTADKVGQFDLESHTTNQTLAVIAVQ